MPLSTARAGLEIQILAALKKAQASKNPETARQQLARDLAQAIYVFTSQAVVNPGQVVTAATPTGPAVGSTTSPGTLS